MSANEAVADIMNDGGAGWVEGTVTQDRRPAGTRRAYIAAGQRQVARFRLTSTVWMLQVVATLACSAKAG